MMKIDAVLGVEEVRRLLRSALAWLDDYRETSSLFGEAEDADERLLGWVAAMQALRFGACQAAALGEHSVMPLLEEALETISTFNDDPICNGEMVAKAAGMLAGLEEVPSAVTQRLARHNEADVRRAIAAHLDPDVPAACALLEELADDAQSNVSNAARASLGEQRSVAWWRGKFDSDPAARLTADELPRYAGILGEIRDALAHPWWQAERKIVARLPELVAALPPVLSLELAGRLLKTEHLAAEIAAKILAAILPLEGATDLLCEHARYRAEHDEHWHGRARFAATASLVDPQVRRARASELMARAAARPWSDRQEQLGDAAKICEMAAGLWPKEADPTPIIDVIVSLPDENGPEDDRELDWVACNLDDALQVCTADIGALLPRIVEARLADYAGGWKRIQHEMDKWLERAPVEMLRAAAERGVRSDKPAVVTWSVGKLFGRCFDPTRDGNGATLVERFMAQPATRHAIIDSHNLVAYAAPVLRRELREGVLDHRGASAALTAIAQLWGGRALEHAFEHSSRRATEQEQEKSQTKKRADLKGFLGPKKLHGPITAEEWDRYREARRGMELKEYQQWSSALRLLPAGPWHPEDRALLERAITAAREQERGIVMPVAIALSCKLFKEDDAIWDELMRIGTDEDRDWLRSARRCTEQAMGIKQPGRKKAGGKKETERDRGEWMDEPEER